MSSGNAFWQVFLIFFRLGCTAFGGPVAHLAYFREVFVRQRQWLSEGAYAELIALCQFLPGPASSQAGMALGMMRAGYAGALAAWLGFTLPSALIMIGLGATLQSLDGPILAGALFGLKLVAAAVVTQAAYGMFLTLCPDVRRRVIMCLATMWVLVFPAAGMQLGVLVLAVLVGWRFLAVSPSHDHAPLPTLMGTRAGLRWLLAFVVVLLILTAAGRLYPDTLWAPLAGFYRAGALVFGGGHVVLPLLQAELVEPGWVSHQAFLAGYGAAQAMPGPLFTIAGFLGASLEGTWGGWLGGIAALLGIFLPAFLLLAAGYPFWQKWSRQAIAVSVVAGVNAAVVGLLVAALWRIGVEEILPQPAACVGYFLALLALMKARVPAWLLTLGAATAGAFVFYV